DAKRFCDLLSALPQEKRAGRRYRLPTEAEWERACRGGVQKSQPFSFGDTLTSHQANIDGNFPLAPARSGPCAVGGWSSTGGVEERIIARRPNHPGLDMNLMTPSAIFLAALLGWLVPTAEDSEQVALRHVQKLGGSIHRNAKKPGKPVQGISLSRCADD